MLIIQLPRAGMSKRLCTTRVGVLADYHDYGVEQHLAHLKHLAQIVHDYYHPVKGLFASCVWQLNHMHTCVLVAPCLEKWLKRARGAGGYTEAMREHLVQWGMLNYATIKRDLRCELDPNTAFLRSFSAIQRHFGKLWLM